MAPYGRSLTAGRALLFLAQKMREEGVPFDDDLFAAALLWGEKQTELSTTVESGVDGAWARKGHITKTMAEYSTGAEWLAAVQSMPWDLSIELPEETPTTPRIH